MNELDKAYLREELLRWEEGLGKRIDTVLLQLKELTARVEQLEQTVARAGHPSA